MTDAVKRFDFRQVFIGPSYIPSYAMKEDIEGDYVLHADLAAKLAQVEQDVQEADSVNTKLISDNEKVTIELHAAKSRLATLEAENTRLQLLVDAPFKTAYGVSVEDVGRLLEEHATLEALVGALPQYEEGSYAYEKATIALREKGLPELADALAALLKANQKEKP